MTDSECGRVRDLLPLHAVGTIDGEVGRDVERHLAGCEACREEAAFLARVLRARPEPPADLAASIVAAASARTRLRTAPPRERVRGFAGVVGTLVELPWPLKAAAVLLLALGVGTLFRSEPAPFSPWVLALESEASVEWYGPEWMVAGEAQLDALSDEQLRALLEEMEP